MIAGYSSFYSPQQMECIEGWWHVCQWDSREPPAIGPGEIMVLWRCKGTLGPPRDLVDEVLRFGVCELDRILDSLVFCNAEKWTTLEEAIRVLEAMP